VPLLVPVLVVHVNALTQMVMFQRDSTSNYISWTNERNGTVLCAVLQGNKVDLYTTAKHALRTPNYVLATALSGITPFSTTDIH
jgi:hypothetical protein